MSSHKRTISRSQEVEYTTSRSGKNKRSHCFTPSKRPSTSPAKRTSLTPFSRGPLFPATESYSGNSMEPLLEHPDEGDFVTEVSRKKTKVLSIIFLFPSADY